MALLLIICAVVVIIALIISITACCYVNKRIQRQKSSLKYAGTEGNGAPGRALNNENDLAAEGSDYKIEVVDQVEKQTTLRRRQVKRQKDKMYISHKDNKDDQGS